MFGFRSDKWSPGNPEPELPEQVDRRRLSISRSGRFKQQSKKRMALVDNIYSDPESEEKVIVPPNIQDECRSEDKHSTEVTNNDSEDMSRSAPSDFDRREAALSKIRLHLKETAI